jgi:hypothetical protein
VSPPPSGVDLQDPLVQAKIDAAVDAARKRRGEES